MRNLVQRLTNIYNRVLKISKGHENRIKWIL